MNQPNEHAARHITIPASAGRPEQTHVFEDDSIAALDAALAARRPLLVYGEPGIGKSQLAIAAALRFGRAYVHSVVDAHTEARELLWHHDAVARLAEAQLQAALKDPEANPQQRLKLLNYIRPGPLWWTFDWADASRHIVREDIAIECSAPPQPDLQRCQHENGCVLLIDEIDKAESDVPNGLLEALGAGTFPVPGRAAPVAAGGIPPLVIITSNGERTLPEAFVRRCLVLHLALPDVATRPRAFKDKLVERGRAHLKAQPGGPADFLLTEAATQLAADRLIAQQSRWLPLPGQAEYLDLVHAVLELAGDDPEKQGDTLGTIGDFMLKKHPDAAAAALARRAKGEPADSGSADG